MPAARQVIYSSEVSVGQLHCVIPEKTYTNPMESHRKFLGGGGILKAKFLEAMYEKKLEFPGGEGGGVQNKNLQWG